jgi:predicted HicB family RNase H-like nuclease
MKKVQEKTIHLSAKLTPEVARAAKIQAITEGVSLQAWISQAIIRQLAVSKQEPTTQAGKPT